MSELIKADNEYKEWIAGISTDFRKSQIRASMKINDEMLRFYWKLGKGISSMSEQFGYGMGFYKTVSDDLKSIFPDVKSFSPTNLKYMRYFYEMYPDVLICPRVEDELITDANRPQVGDDLQIIFTLGLLICKDMDKVEAQYALESTSQPLGISSYELSKLIPEEFKGSMPTIEEIEAELNE